MALRAVTLDAAGTLLDVAEPVGATYARIAASHGLAVAPAEVEARFRRALAAAPPLAFRGTLGAELAERERGWWRAIVREVLGPGGDGCFEELYAHYASPRAWRVFSEVPAALTALRAGGLKLAVVSNFDGRLEGLLAGLGLTPLLDLVVHSTRIGHAKPDPRIFHATLAALGTVPPETLHAGDGVEADVEGARAAGLRAVLVDRAGRRPPLPPGVRAIGSLAELPALAG